MRDYFSKLVSKVDELCGVSLKVQRFKINYNKSPFFQGVLSTGWWDQLEGKPPNRALESAPKDICEWIEEMVEKHKPTYMLYIKDFRGCSHDNVCAFPEIDEAIRMYCSGIT